jgi:hypothetical protein
MKRTRRVALLLILCSTLLSVLWGSYVARNSSGGLADFKAIFYGSRCLIAHTDPYNPTDFLHAYLADGSKIPAEPVMADLFRRSVLVCINLPTTLVFLVPLAWLPVVPAYVLWAAVMTVGLTLAGFLMWDLAASASPRLSLLLICILASNCVILFADGNVACIVVSLCVVAVWCFLQEKFVPAGILCLAISMAIKPHDGGLVWLYFLLAGGIYRKRAMQTLLVTVMLSVPSILLVAHAVPHWLPEMRSNLLTASAHGGLNDPGPASVGFHHPDPIISLQGFISVLQDEPGKYVPASYLIFFALLVPWLFATVRSRFSQHRTWLALAAIAAISMLVTYHRQHDAKLLLLTIPACALLWAEGGVLRWFALLANSAALLITGDVPATALEIETAHLPLGTAFLEHLRTALLVRPAPLILLLVAIFYVWVYVRRSAAEPATSPVNASKVVWSAEMETANNS